ncbi:MAG: FAD-dependent oxidoreductase [Anaerolineae bacterium]|nr:FAD-dependent oxidoreductase [Anaerolineae bacterium]
MISKPDEQIILLGGGVAGLATGLELVRRGRQVTVIEKGPVAGGLAQTFQYETPAGVFRFDIGGHRFHSHKPEIIGWVQDLMGADLLYVPRISRIYLSDDGKAGGKFVDYPLQFPGALSIFSPGQAVKILSSYAAATVRNRLGGSGPDVSFEDWVVRRFGRALYEVYFEPYTEKVWGISCQDLSADWAAQRISLPSLSEAVKRAISPGAAPPATIISHFWYPRLGFGMIPNRMKREIERLGGRVLLGTGATGVTPLESGGFAVTINDGRGSQILDADRVISSIPMNFLLACLPTESGSRQVAEDFKLRYRDIILIYLAIKTRQVSNDSWTYFPGRSLLVGRTHEPKNWSPLMAPDGYTSLAAEVFTSQGEPTWEQADEVLVQRAVDDLTGIGFMTAGSLHQGWVKRVRFAYPVYDIGYADKVKTVRQFLAQWPNLHLVGRTGSFRYMNSDGVIEDALRMADYLTGVRGEYVDVSQGYKVD